MNRARKLIAFIRDAAAGISRAIEHPECSIGDIIDARARLAHLRADLDEADQVLRAEQERRIKRRDPLVPGRAAITDREVRDYAERLHASCGGDPEDEVLASISHDRAVEAPVGRPLAGAPARRAPGRYTWDHHARRLLAASGTLQVTQRPA